MGVVCLPFAAPLPCAVGAEGLQGIPVQATAILEGRPDEIPFRTNGNGFIRLASAVTDFSRIENVYLADFDLLVNLLFFELGVLRLIQGSGLFPGGFEVEALEQVGKIGTDRIAL
jgi:hypothetical protein